MAAVQDLRSASATTSMADKGDSPSGSATTSLSSEDRPTCKNTSEAVYSLFYAVEESDGTNQQRSGADSCPVAVGNQTVKGGVKQVWIVGLSYVYWAEKQAVARKYRAQLGIPHDAAKVTWLGKNGMG